MKYSITIREVLKRTVSTEADTAEQALEKIMEEYCSEQIVLDSGDHKSTDVVVDAKGEDKCGHCSWEFADGNIVCKDCGEVF